MTPKESKYVTITRVKYNELERDRRKLRALHAAGVYSWEYYHDTLITAGLIEDTRVNK